MSFLEAKPPPHIVPLHCFRTLHRRMDSGNPSFSQPPHNPNLPLSKTRKGHPPHEKQPHWFRTLQRHTPASTGFRKPEALVLQGIQHIARTPRSSEKTRRGFGHEGKCLKFETHCSWGGKVLVWSSELRGYRLLNFFFGEEGHMDFGWYF